MMKGLVKIVYEIVTEKSDGLKHVDVVRAVRQRGYVFNGPLSITVHNILCDLVKCGAITRNENELLERRYSLSDFDACSTPEDCATCPYELAAVCEAHKSRLAMAALKAEYA
jgi:hypothetical protein